MTRGIDHHGRLPLLQEYVPGRAMAVSAVIDRGRVVARIARETLSFYPIQGGTSVWKRTVSPHDAGVDAATRLLLELGYQGLAEVEYQVGDSGPCLMEIGLRAHGWVTLAVSAGVDLPCIAADVLMGRTPTPGSTYRVGAEMRWPKGDVLRLTALRHGATRPPGVSRLDVARAAWPPWRPGMRYDGVFLDDLSPWLPAPFTERLARLARR
jgi:ATP-grasp in the biosynthetic pathway with Ter operon